MLDENENNSVISSGALEDEGYHETGLSLMDFAGEKIVCGLVCNILPTGPLNFKYNLIIILAVFYFPLLET